MKTARVLAFIQILYNPFNTCTVRIRNTTRRFSMQPIKIHMILKIQVLQIKREERRSHWWNETL